MNHNLYVVQTFVMPHTSSKVLTAVITIRWPWRLKPLENSSSCLKDNAWKRYSLRALCREHLIHEKGLIWSLIAAASKREFFKEMVYNIIHTSSQYGNVNGCWHREIGFIFCIWIYVQQYKKIENGMPPNRIVVNKQNLLLKNQH